MKPPSPPSEKGELGYATFNGSQRRLKLGQSIYSTEQYFGEALHYLLR